MTAPSDRQGEETRMPPEFGVGWREYFDIHFGHLNQGVAELKAQMAASQTRHDAEQREALQRIDALERENDERRGRDRNVDATLNWIKWVLAPVIAAVVTMAAKLLVGS